MNENFHEMDLILRRGVQYGVESLIQFINMFNE